MTSAIDPTKPADGVPAVKADLRDNLRAAKLEIEALQAAQIPTGGLTSQVLAKVSAADFHTDWVDQTGGDGEATTASNVGDGVGLFKQKVDGNLEFKTLVAGANMAINLQGDTLEFAASASGGSSAHFIDVKNDFGAVGDGSTDDTTAIQNALDAAPTKGAIIFFPRGSYRTTSALVIPSVTSGILKPVRLEGENASVIDGGASGWAGGASSIWCDHAGVCIDAYSALPDLGGKSPDWGGGIRNLSIHNVGSGTIGLEANALLNAVFQNVLFRGFPKNLKVRGHLYYSMWDNVMSQRGQADFSHDVVRSGDGGTQFNGVAFFRCTFSGCSANDGPAFRTGEVQSWGQFLKFTHCYFENNEAGSVDIGRCQQVIFDKCYFEDQDGSMPWHVRAEVRTLVGDTSGSVVFDTCYVRFGNQDGSALVQPRATSGSNHVNVSLKDLWLVDPGTGSSVVATHPSGSAAKIDITSMNGRVGDASDSCPLFNGSLENDVGELFTINCMFAEDWSATGNQRNCIKGGLTVL